MYKNFELLKCKILLYSLVFYKSNNSFRKLKTYKSRVMWNIFKIHFVTLKVYNIKVILNYYKINKYIYVFYVCTNK